MKQDKQQREGIEGCDDGDVDSDGGDGDSWGGGTSDSSSSLCVSGALGTINLYLILIRSVLMHLVLFASNLDRRIYSRIDGRLAPKRGTDGITG